MATDARPLHFPLSELSADRQVGYKFAPRLVIMQGGRGDFEMVLMAIYSEPSPDVLVVSTSYEPQPLPVLDLVICISVICTESSQSDPFGEATASTHSRWPL